MNHATALFLIVLLGSCMYAAGRCTPGSGTASVIGSVTGRATSTATGPAEPASPGGTGGGECGTAPQKIPDGHLHHRPSGHDLLERVSAGPTRPVRLTPGARRRREPPPGAPFPCCRPVPARPFGGSAPMGQRQLFRNRLCALLFRNWTWQLASRHGRGLPSHPAGPGLLEPNATGPAPAPCYRASVEADCGREVPPARSSL